MEKKHLGVGLGVPSGVKLKVVPGSGGLYSAGSDGRIYCHSEARCNAKKPKPFALQSFQYRGGYPLVSVVLQGRRKSVSVHTLVCRAFHGTRPSEIHEVRHLDGNRDNSRPDNLAWGTPSQNEADKRRHGTAAIGSRHGIAKLNEEAVRIIRVAVPQGLWNPVDAAKVFGVDPSVIRAVVRGKAWKHVDVE